MNDDLPTDPEPSHTEEGKELDIRKPEAARLEVLIPDLPSSKMQHSDPATHSNTQRQIRRSNRTKKPSGRWNEEAEFVPQPPRSTKKKIPEKPREGTPTLINSIFSTLSNT